MVNNNINIKIMEYGMRKYLTALIITLVIFTGCDALGIKQADNASTDNASQADVNSLSTSASLDNQISASDGIQPASEEILKLQKEIDELVSTVNTKDITITELEDKVQNLENEKQELAAQFATTEAELIDLKDTISTNNQYRNIAIIVAAASLLCNILLVFLLIRYRMRNKRAALPPAKSDAPYKADNNKADDKISDNKDIPADSTVSNIENNTDNEKTNVSDNEKHEDNTSKKRGRPKTVNSEVTKENENIDKPAVKRGRPKKEK